MLATLGLASGHELALFMAAVLLLNATPGVDLLLTVSRTLQGGARAGAAAVLGIGAGCAVHALAAAFGLAALLALSAQAFTVLKLLGAAWLLWLALGMARAAWRTPPARPQAGVAQAPARTRRADFRAGLLTNLLNPKVVLFMLAFLPQFIAPAAPHKTLAFLGLGALFVLQGTLFGLAVVALSARLRRLPAPPAAGRWLQGAGAALLALLAARLVMVKP